MNEWLELQHLNRGIIGTGGLCEVLAIPTEDILLFPPVNPATQTLTADIQIHSGRKWLAFMLQSKSRAVKEESQIGAGGILYNQIVSGNLSGQDPDNHLTIGNMIFHRWVVIARERKTGNAYVVGKPWCGAKLSIKYESQRGTISELNFTCQSKTRAYLYGGASSTVVPEPEDLPPNIFLRRMIIEFKIGDPGRPADESSSLVIPELAGKPRIALFIDGAMISLLGYTDRLAATYSSEQNRIETSRPLAFGTLIQVYECV